MQEVFTTGSIEEALTTLPAAVHKYGAYDHAGAIIKVAIRLAMDRGPRECELVSQLIAELPALPEGVSGGMGGRSLVPVMTRL